MGISSTRISLICLFIELLTFTLIGLSFGNGWVMDQIFLDGVETEVRCGIYELCFKLRIGPPEFRCWYINKFGAYRLSSLMSLSMLIGLCWLESVCAEVNTALVQAGRIFLTSSAVICWVTLCVTFLHAFGTIQGRLLPQLIAKSVLCKKPIDFCIYNKTSSSLKLLQAFVCWSGAVWFKQSLRGRSTKRRGWGGPVQPAG